MSDHEYIPKSKAGKWFNDRLPLLTLGAHLTDYPTPKNLNYWWTQLKQRDIDAVNKKATLRWLFKRDGGSCWVRTSDQLVKSQLLYRLS